MKRKKKKLPGLTAVAHDDPPMEGEPPIETSELRPERKKRGARAPATVAIALNASYLRDLARTLGGDEVILTVQVKREGGPIKVRLLDADDDPASVVLMAQSSARKGWIA